MIELPKLVLASGSPRRAEILNSVGWPFDKIVADVDESVLSGESARDYVERLAREKALAVASQLSGERLVLGADTTVVVDDRIVGKPEDLNEAKEMLTMLSGRLHTVLTGVALTFDGRVVSGVEKTGVEFRKMTEEEIDFLAHKGNPLDKAGAYAVQAQAALFISGISGDYWNVVGLPIGLVYRLMKTEALAYARASAERG